MDIAYAKAIFDKIKNNDISLHFGTNSETIKFTFDLDWLRSVSKEYNIRSDKVLNPGPGRHYHYGAFFRFTAPYEDVVSGNVFVIVKAGDALVLCLDRARLNALLGKLEAEKITSLDYTYTRQASPSGILRIVNELLSGKAVRWDFELEETKECRGFRKFLDSLGVKVSDKFYPIAASRYYPDLGDDAVYVYNHPTGEPLRGNDVISGKYRLKRCLLSDIVRPKRTVPSIPKDKVLVHVLSKNSAEVSEFVRSSGSLFS